MGGGGGILNTVMQIASIVPSPVQPFAQAAMAVQGVKEAAAGNPLGILKAVPAVSRLSDFGASGFFDASNASGPLAGANAAGEGAVQQSLYGAESTGLAGQGALTGFDAFAKAPGSYISGAAEHVLGQPGFAAGALGGGLSGYQQGGLGGALSGALQGGQIGSATGSLLGKGVTALNGGEAMTGLGGKLVGAGIDYASGAAGALSQGMPQFAAPAALGASALGATGQRTAAIPMSSGLSGGSAPGLAFNMSRSAKPVGMAMGAIPSAPSGPNVRDAQRSSRANQFTMNAGVGVV